MGGFLIEGIIRSIVKKVRVKSRVSAAQKWPVAEGRVSSLGFNKTGTSIVPRLMYSYETDGETHYGFADCFPSNEANEGIASESTNALEKLVVRYNPDDPLDSRLLNTDNTGLRLEINHEPD